MSDPPRFSVGDPTKIHEQPKARFKIQFTGLFGISMSLLDFIAKFYGVKLANFLRDEYSPAILDIANFELDPQVKEELSKLPDDWGEVYAKMENRSLLYSRQYVWAKNLVPSDPAA